MKEFLELLEVAKRLRADGQPFAVATVVKIGGSSYRRPGARMLIDRSGMTWGTISGGCLEGEVAAHAIEVLKDGLPRLIPFDLADDDVVLGFGTGCDGVVHVFVEPVLESTLSYNADGDVLALFDKCMAARSTAVLGTLTWATGELADAVGCHYMVGGSADGAQTGADTAATISRSGRANESTSDNGSTIALLHEDIIYRARKLFDKEKSSGELHLWRTERISTDAGEADVLLEIVRPPVRMLIFGDGHDVRSMVSVGRTMGWRIDIVGRRPVDELQRRFPNADRHVFLMHPEQVLDQVQFDGRTAAIVMNHSFTRDRSLLASLLQTELAYIGLLGPAERTERMLSELAEDGAELGADVNERVFGPIGLDIGTETPEEIALATAAEIQAVFQRRSSGSLRDRGRPIHAERVK